jgi:hypothetical protein
MVGEYWFRLSCLSMMVIGSFASYTKTKSVESAIWCWLTLDDGVIFFTGSKYLKKVQYQNCYFLFSNNNNKHWWKWNKANNQTMNKINERLIRIRVRLTGIGILYNQINHEWLFIATSLNVTVLVLHRVKTKDCITRVVWKLRVPTGQLKGHLTSSQGDHWDWVHSDQMVLAMVRRGRLVR